jgi:hypothetical protein
MGSKAFVFNLMLIQNPYRQPIHTKSNVDSSA